MKTFEEKRAALQKSLAKKEGVTKVALVNVYGDHAMSVLMDVYVDRATVPQAQSKKRPPNRYVSLRPLPSKEKFVSELHEMYTTNAKSLIEDGYSQIEDLASECSEIVDNSSGTNFENTQRIQTFSETADTLGNISLNNDLPDWLESVSVVRLPTISDRSGRSHRLDEALSDLSVAIEAINEYVCKDDQTATSDVESPNGDKLADSIRTEREDEAKTLTDEIQEHIDECSGCEFPGMYG